MRCLFLCVLAIAIGMVARPAIAAAGSAPRLEVTDCPRDLRSTGRHVVCGVVRVPQDKGEPHGLQLVLPVTIVKAAAPRTGLPPVLYLHGGPGGNATRYVADLLRGPVGRELIGQDQDWVFFDQRGSGRSSPRLDCPGAVLNDAGPASAQAVAALVRCAGRWRAAGVRFDQYVSARVVEDISAIRRALGIRSYDLIGYSYGSRVAAAVLTHAPEGLRAVIQDSPWPPEAKWTEPGPGWVSREVRKVLAACAMQQLCRARYGDGQIVRLDAQMRRWRDAAPEQGAGRDMRNALALFLMDALYDAEGVARLPQTLERILSGDHGPLMPFVEGDGSGYAQAQHLAVLCNEELPFELAGRVIDDARGDPVAEAVAATMVNYFDACPAFAGRVPDPIEQTPVRTDLPTLFLSAGIDPGCPAELSEAAARGYRAGQFVLFSVATHGLIFNNGCARRMARAFLRSPSAPVGRDCLSVEATGLVFALS